MSIKPYTVGTAPESWGGASVQTLGFVVTEAKRVQSVEYLLKEGENENFR